MKDDSRTPASSFFDRPLTGLAAEMTFFAVLSVFPVLLVLAAALGQLEELLGYDIATGAETAVVQFLELVLTEKASFLVDAARDLFRMESGGLLTSAVFVALWTFSSTFGALIRALDMIYEVAERRSWLNIRLTALGLALGTIVILSIILGDLVLGPFLGVGPYLARHLGLSGAFFFVWSWLKGPVALSLIVIWLTTLYHLAPNIRRRWLRDMPGGALAAVFWILASYGFNFYLRLAVTTNQLLGVLGGGLILMMWLYLLSVGVLLGGELNAFLMRRGSPR